MQSSSDGKRKRQGKSLYKVSATIIIAFAALYCILSVLDFTINVEYIKMEEGNEYIFLSFFKENTLGKIWFW